MRSVAMRVGALIVAALLGVGLVPVSSGEAAAASRPKIAKLSVHKGPTAGGTAVVVKGKNFTSESTVWFGSNPAASVRYVSSKKLVAVTPASGKGKAVVRVTTPAGRSAAAGARTRFTFVAPPKVKSLSARSGPVKGGQKLTIKGSGFTKVSKLLFGDVKGKKLKVKSGSKLTVVTPAHTNGYVEVKVVGRYGTSVAASYLYGTAPVAVVGGPARSADQLAVASFNITVATGTATSSNPRKRPWAERRGTVAGQILREGIDVVGVQEASASAREVPSGVPQFQDLANLLNESGGTYALTNTLTYCNNLAAGGKCPNGAGQSDRIIYNTSRLELVRQGSRSLDSRLYPDGSARHVTWAQFNDLNTGRSFFFVTTHLEPSDEGSGEDLRTAQARLILQEIAEENTANLPVVLVGDLATTKFSLTNAAHTEFINAGYADPLGNTYRLKAANDPAVFAQQLTNVRYSSLNSYGVAPKTVSDYEIGSYMDYILLSSRSITAFEWKTVVDLDAAGNFTGVIPSDHNLVMLTLTLP